MIRDNADDDDNLIIGIFDVLDRVFMRVFRKKESEEE
jgi:hypothetical protein